MGILVYCPGSMRPIVVQQDKLATVLLRESRRHAALLQVGTAAQCTGSTLYSFRFRGKRAAFTRSLLKSV
jgi:hypothetical protein